MYILKSLRESNHFLFFPVKCSISKLKRKPDHNVFMVIEEIIEIFSLDPNTRRPLFTSEGLVTSLLELVMVETTPFYMKKEVLELLTQVASLKISADCRTGIRNKNGTLFLQLVSQITELGDYEAQITILELLIRFGGQQDMPLARQWFKSEEMAIMFSKIERKCFEVQAR